MQAPSNGTKDVRWPATRIKGRQLVLASSIWLAGLHSLSLAAQELETPRAVRDTFSINSGYFSKDYANNIDYAQFVMDVRSATSRLALYGYDKYADRLNGPFSRFGYLVASGWLYLLTDVGLAYHEWGHASRTVALGGTATLSSCYDRACPAPRDFFGYAGSQVFNFKGGYARNEGGVYRANASSGKAVSNIMLGGGVNNETLVADKSDEHHFLRGSGNAFEHLRGNLAIASYGIKGPEGDIGMMAEEYRFKGVDKKITEDDLRNTNMLSLISGSIYMIDTQEIEKFAVGAHGRKVSLAAMLKRSNPFHCMFCCPMSINGGYFQKYFRSQADSSVTRQHEEMPSYALRLLYSREQQGENVSLSREALPEDFPSVRAVGIYDLRDRE